MDNIVYDKNIFAANLQRLMKRDREKQIDVARLLDVSKSTVSAYCAGAQMPRMDKLELLARHYGVTIAALVESKREPAPAAQGRRRAVPALPRVRDLHGLNRRGQASTSATASTCPAAGFRAERLRASSSATSCPPPRATPAHRGRGLRADRVSRGRAALLPTSA